MKRYYRPATGSYINDALTLLYVETVRDRLEGRAAVESLLKLRGVDPASIYVPEKKPKRFKRGELSKLVLKALESGPKRPYDVHKAIEGASYICVCDALVRLRDRGVARKKCGFWVINSTVS